MCSPEKNPVESRGKSGCITDENLDASQFCHRKARLGQLQGAVCDGEVPLLRFKQRYWSPGAYFGLIT